MQKLLYFSDQYIFLKFEDGDIKQLPLNNFPKLLHATKKERLNFTFSPMGIHWEKLDEDLSFKGFN